MSAVHAPRGLRIPPPKDRPVVSPKPPAEPSLRWRIRRWILKRLDAWPREKPEPRTEWGELRRAERKRLAQENRRLRAALVRIEEGAPTEEPTYEDWGGDTERAEVWGGEQEHWRCAQIARRARAEA